MKADCSPHFSHSNNTCLSDEYEKNIPLMTVTKPQHDCTGRAVYSCTAYNDKVYSYIEIVLFKISFMRSNYTKNHGLQ